MLLLFLGILSIIAFILFGIDKRRAARHRWRISEAALLTAACFGGIGALAGMLFFHHKTRKWKFRILVPIFAAMQLSILVLLVLPAA